MSSGRFSATVQGNGPQTKKSEKKKEITISDLAQMFLADRKLQTLTTPKRTSFIDGTGYVKLKEYLSFCDDILVSDMTKLLALTDCRKEKIALLKWSYIDFDKQVFHFPGTKTGAQDRPFRSSVKRFLLALIEKKQPASQSDYIFGAPYKMMLI